MEKDSKDRHCWRSRTVMAKEFSKRAPSPAIATYGPLTTGANPARPPFPSIRPATGRLTRTHPPPAPPARPTDRPQSKRIGHPEERAATRRDRGRPRVPNSAGPGDTTHRRAVGGLLLRPAPPPRSRVGGLTRAHERGATGVWCGRLPGARARARGTHGQRGGELEFGMQREGGRLPPPSQVATPHCTT
ncbi:hypothetical protein NL676_032771 [Syzygium grande]|nr:hypothetical protein NL676_032771 [Syzygium grande]